MSDCPESLLEVLAHHDGEGNVYLAPGTSKDTVRQAIVQGLISQEGYLTRKGRALLAQHVS
ncbi:MAG: hypothetical protein ACREWG_04595 [Gammaproteobacteria bacterium]